MQMMIFWVMVMMVMLKTWNYDGVRAFNINWLRYVSRHGDVLLLDDRNMPNFLHENGNLSLDHNLFNLAMVPVANVIIARPRVISVVLFLQLPHLLAHDRFRWHSTADDKKKKSRLELLVCLGTEEAKAIKQQMIY